MIGRHVVCRPLHTNVIRDRADMVGRSPYCNCVGYSLVLLLLFYKFDCLFIPKLQKIGVHIGTGEKFDEFAVNFSYSVHLIRTNISSYQHDTKLVNPYQELGKILFPSESVSQ